VKRVERLRHKGKYGEGVLDGLLASDRGPVVSELPANREQSQSLPISRLVVPNPFGIRSGTQLRLRTGRLRLSGA
jgi:hypothetical protein